MKKTSPKGSSKGYSPKVITKRTLSEQLNKPSSSDQVLGSARLASIQLLNKSIQAQFKEQAKAFKLVLDDMPDLSSMDVIRLCIHLALQKEDYESAARWAKELVEFEKPKLSRREIIEKDEEKELSDEELQQALADEGVVVDFGKAQKAKAKKRSS